MKAIEIQALSRAFGGRNAVDALSLDVEQGEFLALLGVNGAGKTTLIKMLSCLLQPSSGDALLLGDSIVSSPDRVKRKINISPQETAVAPNLSARENLELIAGVYGAGRAQAREKAETMLHEFGMEHIAAQKAKTLSGGWQRRLSIAMALISRPQILFLDEPTLGLDVLARRELWNVIERLRGKVTIILTTHYLEEAETLSDRIAILQSGCLRACGTAAQIKAMAGTDNFEEAFVRLAAKEAER